jgi:ketosteroid isomerase-like protein
MSNTDIVQASLDAWCRADWDTYSSLLTDDFLYDDPSQPLDKNAWLGFGRAMLTAFPDWSFNSSGLRENGDKVYNTSRISGTHTGVLSPGMGLPTVSATGKHVEAPPEEEVFTLRGGQISRLAITFSPDGDLAAVYAQLGVPLS